jgi:VIT1/CCC1 family predicted Fe2+/Mn2+ transporter
VFGMNDGLVSNLSLILGVAGAGVEPRTVVVTGFAGLLAGAFSMAAGEYISVASQRDLLTRQIALEKREIAEAPEEEAAELALIFKQKGLSTEQASRTAAEILKNPESAADTLVREELGLDPDDLGSPKGAAVASFALISVGAFVPLVPFLLTSGTPAVTTASALAGLVLAAVGGVLGFLSGTSVVTAAARMVGLAALAAGVTYAVGRIFGAAVG